MSTHAPHAGLDGRNGLWILEAEQAGKAVLRKLALFTQGVDCGTDVVVGRAP